MKLQEGGNQALINLLFAELQWMPFRKMEETVDEINPITIQSQQHLLRTTLPVFLKTAQPQISRLDSTKTFAFLQISKKQN